MALVVLTSAKGAPGVTTLTVALAALTPGAVAADLDPDGGDLALRYRREDGSPLDVERGLLSLAASLRRDPGEFVGAGPIDDHLQVTAGGLEVLLGVRGPDQAIGLGPLWSPLARALTESNRPVFADCGRIGPASPAMPVLLVADAVIMMARAEVEELAHLRERLRFLVATLPSRYSGRARVGVILVAAERDRAAGPRTEQLLRASGVDVSVLGTVADDPRGATRMRGLGSGRAGRTTLVRSVRSLLPAVGVLAGDIPEVARLRAVPESGPFLAAQSAPPAPPVGPSGPAPDFPPAAPAPAARVEPIDPNPPRRARIATPPIPPHPQADLHPPADQSPPRNQFPPDNLLTPGHLLDPGGLLAQGDLPTAADLIPPVDLIPRVDPLPAVDPFPPADPFPVVDQFPAAEPFRAVDPFPQADLPLPDDALPPGELLPAAEPLPAIDEVGPHPADRHPADRPGTGAFWHTPQPNGRQHSNGWPQPEPVEQGDPAEHREFEDVESSAPADLSSADHRPSHYARADYGQAEYGHAGYEGAVHVPALFGQAEYERTEYDSAPAEYGQAGYEPVDAGQAEDEFQRAHDLPPDPYERLEPDDLAGLGDVHNVNVTVSPSGGEN